MGLRSLTVVGHSSEPDGVVEDDNISSPEWLAHFMQRRFFVRRPDVNEYLPVRKGLLNIPLELSDFSGEVLEPLALFCPLRVDRDLHALAVDLRPHARHHSQRRADLGDH